jgi:hypothetical protein
MNVDILRNLLKPVSKERMDEIISEKYGHLQEMSLGEEMLAEDKRKSENKE